MYLLKLIFITHEVTTSFIQEQHPFPQTLNLVDDPTIPGIWINDEVQYFAVTRKEGSRALFCWKLTIPGSPHISTPLGKDATTLPGSCFHHPVHQSTPSFAEWHFNHTSNFHPLTFIIGGVTTSSLVPQPLDKRAETWIYIVEGGLKKFHVVQIEIQKVTQSPR